MRKVIILTFLLFSFSASSQVLMDQFDDIIEEIVPKSSISNAELKALREELKIQKLFIEGVKGIEINGGEIKNIKKSSSTIRELIVSSFKAKSESLPSHIKGKLQNTVRSSVQGDVIEKVLRKTKEFIYTGAKSKGAMMTSVARRFGFDVGLVYFLSLQVDLTFPLIMISQGHFEYAALLATPVSSMATGSYAALKGAVKMRHLIKSFGGFTQARQYFDVYRKVKSFFKTTIIPQFDIIDLNVDGKTYSLTIEKQNLISRMKRALGWNDRLNYRNLIAVLEEEGLMTPLVEKVVKSQRPEKIKLLRVLYRIEMEGDQEVMSLLKSRFGDFVQDFEGLPDFGEGRKWAAKIAHASDFSEFGRLMMSIPEDIPPRVFDRIWRHHILPSASKSVGPFLSASTYKAFRNLINNWESGPRMQMANSVEMNLDNHWRTMLANYFHNSTAGLGCSAIFTPRGAFAPLL